MNGLVLDAGALIAFERADRRFLAIVAQALAHGDRLTVPAGVVAQVWRNGRKQVRLARLLASPIVDVETFTDTRARAAGQLCGASKTKDVVDAAVILCARTLGVGIATSDVGDLSRLDPRVRLVHI